MQERIKVGVYKLPTGGYQTSFLDQHGKRRRQKFNSYRSARNHAQNVAARAFDTVVRHDRQVAAMFIQTYIEKNPDAKLLRRSSKVFCSFVERFGKMDIHDITKLQLSAWFESIKDEYNYSSRSLLQIKYAFTPFFNDLVESNIIVENPLSQVRIKRGTRVKERVVLSESELVQIVKGLKAISAEHIYPVTYFLIHTGCKINEALSLKWNQIDFKNELVHFRSVPSSAERKIRLSPKLATLLKSWPAESEFVFLDDHNRPWTQSYYGKRLRWARAQVCVTKNWDNVSLRHTFAYHFLRKGGTLPQLQVILGHRNISDTTEAYGSIVSRDIEKLSPYGK